MDKVKPKANPIQWWQQDWVLGLFLVVAVFLVYQQVWSAGFIWDDDAHLTRNPCIVGPLGFKEIWTTSAATYYPLVLTSFWLQHAIWGLNPLPYHLVNIAMHAACSVLLWQGLWRLQVRGAWLGAALWALHPVQTESVAWITELKNTQSCLFYLLSILFYVKWFSAAGENPKIRSSWWQYTFSLLCAMMAILSKSSTVMLPVVLGLCTWWLRGRCQKQKFWHLVPFFLIAAVASGWTIWEQKFHSGALGVEWGQSGPERLVIAGKAIWFYLGKLIWPYPLIFIYPRWEINASRLWSYLPVLAAGGGLFVLWLNRKGSGRALFFACTYYLVLLVPLLGFFNVYFFRYSFVGDHFQYLASIGPLALAGTGLAAGWERLEKGRAFLRPVLCGSLLLILGVMTWRQSRMYADDETLWLTTIEHNPACWMAYDNLSVDYLHARRIDESMVYSMKALEIKPDNFVAENNLGTAFLQTEQIKEAISHYSRALELNPNYAEAHYNLGCVFQRTGQVADAIIHWQKALRINPQFTEAQTSLAWVLATSTAASLRDGVKAVELAERANQSSGGRNPMILGTLAAAYAEAGRFSEAIPAAYHAIELANTAGNEAMVKELQEHLKLYQTWRPFHERAPAS